MTSVSLQKGGSVNLTKVNETVSLKKGGNGVLTSLHVGLGWDVHRNISADLDAFIVQVDQSGSLIDTIYFGKKTSTDRAIVHQGDNLTGEGEGDDEVIKIDLSKLSPRTHKLYVAVNIYQCRITFAEVENAFIRILNNKTKDVLMQYNLSQESGKNYALIMGEVEKNADGTWAFNAIGLSTKDRSVEEVKQRILRGLGNVTYTPVDHTNVSPVSTSVPTPEPPRKKGLLGRLFG